MSLSTASKSENFTRVKMTAWNPYDDTFNSIFVMPESCDAPLSKRNEFLREHPHLIVRLLTLAYFFQKSGVPGVLTLAFHPDIEDDDIAHVELCVDLYRDLILYKSLGEDYHLYVDQKMKDVRIQRLDQYLTAFTHQTMHEGQSMMIEAYIYF